MVMRCAHFRLKSELRTGRLLVLLFLTFCCYNKLTDNCFPALD